MGMISTGLIDINMKGITKEEIIQNMTGLMQEEGIIDSAEMFFNDVMEREGLSTTGIGFGIAIPHGKSSTVKRPAVAFGKVENGIQWESLDGKPVRIVFLIAVPKEAASNEHLKILAALSRKLMDEEFRQNLLDIADKEGILGLLGDTLDGIK